MRLIIFSILLLTVLADNLVDRTYSIDQLLNEYELEVQRLPEKDNENVLKPNRSLNELLDLYEKEASLLRSPKRNQANLHRYPKNNDFKQGILDGILGGGPTSGGGSPSGSGPPSGGGSPSGSGSGSQPSLGGISDILNNLLKPITGGSGGLGDIIGKPLCQLLIALADLLRKLATDLTGSLIKSISGTLQYLEPILGSDNFLVRFLNEFFDEQNSPFLTSIEVSKRLDKIMELYWTGGKKIESIY